MAFTFGARYVQQLSASQSDQSEPADQAPTATIPSELPGEVSQHLQRLTKRDGTTKIKALQVREGGGRGRGGVVDSCPVWQSHTRCSRSTAHPWHHLRLAMAT